MTVLTLRTVPDPILHTACRPVTHIDEHTRTLLRHMVETMRAHKGIGLAAPQVGVPKRLFVAEWEGVVYKVVNPSLHTIGTGTEAGEEGCLSLPGYVGTVVRPDAISMWAQDERGQRIAPMVTGLLARCFQHELDHLNGIMFTDKLVPGTTLRLAEVAHEAQPVLAMVGGVSC